MGDTQEVKQLREKIAELTAENRQLLAADPATPAAAMSAPRSKVRLRSGAALILVLISALLAPVAVLGSWVRAELVDTESFVQTLAPLAGKPEVQSFVAAEVSAGIKQNVDIDGMVGALFSGIAETDLPPSAQAVLPLLEGSAASGVRSLIDSGVTAVVESPQFMSVWETALRETHARSIAVIQGDPHAIVQLTDDGTLALDLRTITSQVKDGLVGQGIGFAELIPEIDRKIPLVSSESFLLVRTVYQLAVGLGFWLPWIALAALVAGVLLARRRVRALSRAGLAIAASLLLALMGIGIGKLLFVSAISPSIMPAPTAEVLFAQLTEANSSALTALAVCFLAVAFGGWFAGSSGSAGAVRNATSSGFAAVRRAADRHGINTGAFGDFLERWCAVVLIAALAGATLTLFFMRPITVGGVVAVVLCLLGVLLVVELLRRPAPIQPQTDDADEEPAVSSEQVASH